MVHDNMVTIARDYANMHIAVPSSPTSAPAKTGFVERLRRKTKRKDAFSKSEGSAIPTTTSSDGSPRGVAVQPQSVHDAKTSSEPSKTFSIKEQSNTRVRNDAAEDLQPSAESKSSEKAQSSVHTELENGKEGSKVQGRDKSQQSKLLENSDNQSKAEDGETISRRKRLAVWVASKLCCAGSKTTD